MTVGQSRPRLVSFVFSGVAVDVLQPFSRIFLLFFFFLFSLLLSSLVSPPHELCYDPLTNLSHRDNTNFRELSLRTASTTWSTKMTLIYRAPLTPSISMKTASTLGSHMLQRTCRTKSCLIARPVCRLLFFFMSDLLISSQQKCSRCVSSALCLIRAIRRNQTSIPVLQPVSLRPCSSRLRHPLLNLPHLSIRYLPQSQDRTPPPIATRTTSSTRTRTRAVAARGHPQQLVDRKSTRLNSSHRIASRMPSSA